MEIVKETNEELHIKNKDMDIHAVKRADGGFDISNSKGAKVSMTAGQAKDLISSAPTPIALIGTMDMHDSVKDAMNTPTVKNSVLKTFANFVDLGRANKWIGSKKNLGEEISTALLEYPKVIVEPHYNQDVEEMIREFQEVDQIKLPFPKMTIITGEKVNMDRFININAPSNITTPRLDGVINQDGKVNMVQCYFLSQHEHGIDLDIICGSANYRDEAYVYTTNIIHDGEQLQLLTLKNQVVNISEEHIQSYIGSAIAAIYMMTMGKNNFYMSVPTLEEAATNRKRISKGKKPLIEFKVATIEGKKTMLSSTPHGTHASPRLHWRRGHWRTMTKSGKKTWIAPMEVGDEDNGRVIKTYAIGKYSLMEAR
jgi:hypothetical protein